MILRASGSCSMARRCSYQLIASASSVIEANIRAMVRVSCESSSGGSWYWSNPMVLALSRGAGAERMLSRASHAAEARHETARGRTAECALVERRVDRDEARLGEQRRGAERVEPALRATRVDARTRGGWVAVAQRHRAARRLAREEHALDRRGDARRRHDADERVLGARQVALLRGQAPVGGLVAASSDPAGDHRRQPQRVDRAVPPPGGVDDL